MEHSSEPHHINENHELGIFQQRKTLLLSSILIVFIGALVIRVIYLNQSYMISERQYRSAIIARAFYFEASDSVPEWRASIAATSRERAGILEPPITEFLVSLAYRLVGGEHLWIARMLSSMFWLIGGFFLYKIVEMIVSADAAIFSVAYYLFIPLGIRASMTFLPDPLMIMMLLAGLFAMLWYFEQPSKSRLITASIISGIAILVKPFCLFAIVCAFLALAVYERITNRRIKVFDHFIFILICLSISALFYLYGIIITGSLASNFQAGFLPYLFLEWTYWRNWLVTAVGAVGFTPLIIALIGISLFRNGLSRALVIGLWIGYFLFGLAYTFPIGISGHYHLQLIVIVALSIGPVVVLIVNHISQHSKNWYWLLPLASAFILVAFFNVRELRRDLNTGQKPESEKIAGEIGSLVNNSDKTVYVATFYGMPLEYYGELSGTYWPNRIADLDWVKDNKDGDIELAGASWIQRTISWVFRRVDERDLSIEERLAALDFVPEYFIVSDLEAYERRHADLKEYLVENCSSLSENDVYFVYGNCSR